MVFREDRLQYKRHMHEKKVEQITNDPFFDRHVGVGSDKYSGKTIMDYIRTERTKIS